MYKITKKNAKTDARAGLLRTAHGTLKTPFFMPVATRGTLKHLSTEDLKQLKSQILLSNTYHLMLKPGEDHIEKQGGLHRFMDWPGAILTDSGGFQIFSLAGKREGSRVLVKISENGAEFRSPWDGSKHHLTPEKSLQIQAKLGVDIAVCLDECVALPATRPYLEKSVEMTSRWAERSKAELAKLKNKPLLFAVIQGGLEKDLRLKSLADLKAIGFDGYNIGGLSVGESATEMYKVLDYLMPEMPVDKPRYLMGVGYPENIIEGVKRGVDMFDCVIPTREGRHGKLFVFKKNAPALIAKSLLSKKVNPGDFYETINIKNNRFATDKHPINATSDIAELRGLSKAYLNYLYKIDEPLSARLSSLNNLEFYLRLMRLIRQAI